MAVDAPTVDDFITRFPSFEGQEDLIEAILPEAIARVNEDWKAEDQKPAIMYLAAHMVTMEGSADSLPVISETLGPISTSYGYTADIQKNAYFRTEYGRRWWEYYLRNGSGGAAGAGGVVVVGGVTPRSC